MRVVVVAEAWLILCSQTVAFPVLLKIMRVVRVVDYVTAAKSALFWQ
jgi:hypothetical protein